MTTTDNARNQAIAQMEYVEGLLGAFNMDWEFLADLQDHCEEEDLETLQELTEQSADCSDADEALERLRDNPLEIQFRSGWESHKDDLTPTEFSILLCTGGPAVRIRGELDHNGYPYRAWTEYCDWGIQWTELGSYQSVALECAQLLIQEN